MVTLYIAGPVGPRQVVQGVQYTFSKQELEQLYINELKRTTQDVTEGQKEQPSRWHYIKKLA